LPWNAFITAVDYFSSLNPNFPFAFWVGLAFNYPNIAMLFANVAIGYVKADKSGSKRKYFIFYFWINQTITLIIKNDLIANVDI